MDAGHIAQQHFGAVVGCDHGDIVEFAAEIPPLLHPHQDVTAFGFDGSPRQLDGGGAYFLGHVIQCQAIGAQGVLGDRDADFIVADAFQIHLRDFRILEHAHPQILGQLAQGPFTLVAIEDDRDHRSLTIGNGHLRRFGFIRERRDLIHLVLDFLREAVGIGSLKNLHRDSPDALVGRGGHFLDPLQPLDRFLDGPDNAPLHFGRAGTGIGHRNGDEIEIKIRKDFLLDACAPDQAAHQEDHHQEIGRHRVTRHPGDGVAGRMRCRRCFHH